MLKSFVAEYQKKNPEKFNHDFIMSRDNSENLLATVTDIFKSLEILKPLKILKVWLEEDESHMPPIETIDKNTKFYSKAVQPSRLIRCYYTYEIDLQDQPTNKRPRGIYANAKTAQVRHRVITNYFYLNKLIDDLFFINEGSRYFLIYQIVDTATYSSERSVSLKSLLMPITIHKATNMIQIATEGTNQAFKLPSYEVFLFKKKVNPLLYIFGKFAYESLSTIPYDPDTIVYNRENHVDKGLLARFNQFMGVDLKFSNDQMELLADDRYVFKIQKGPYISVDKVKLDAEDPALYNTLGLFFTLTDNSTKKGTITFTAEDITKPIFWCNILSGFFTANTDPVRKFEKTKTMILSLDRLIDQPTRNTLKLDENDKESTLTILRYMLTNFNDLLKVDNNDLINKRLRLTEYQLYYLRKVFSDQIYRILNLPSPDMNDYLKIFSNLQPMKIIQQTVTNELVRYYNTTNELNFFTFLKCTQKGPQSVNKVVSMATRDVHPSHVGRESLVASSAGSPGLSGCLVPFVEVDENLYFKE